jgi:hypothetical protein
VTAVLILSSPIGSKPQYSGIECVGVGLGLNDELGRFDIEGFKDRDGSNDRYLDGD